MPSATLDPKVVLLGLLPLLAYDAAITTSPTALLRHARSIGVLAVLLVLATAVSVATVAHWAGGLSWPVAFVLGTAVGPTDAAAATSVARRIGLPRRLLATLEGEALFNDATALVLYAAAVGAATTGTFSALHTVGSILYATVVAIVIGLAAGFLGRLGRSFVNDPPIEIAASILLAYAAYLPAEELGASGLLAAVVAGLYLGWHSSSGAFSAATRLQSEVFWQTLVFLINAVLFVFVGLSFHAFTAAARGPLSRLALTAVAVVATVIVVRLLWMWAPWQHLVPRRARGARTAERSPRERLVLGWSGMRGAITLAALLAVPTVTSHGQPLAGRDDVISLGFAVIIATLLIQGMTLPALVSRLRLSEHPAVADAEREARLALAEAALAHIDHAVLTDGLPAEMTDGLRARYVSQARRLQPQAAGADDEIALQRDLTCLQRGVLSRLRDRGRIGVTTLRTLQRELDLQEAAMERSVD